MCIVGVGPARVREQFAGGSGIEGWSGVGRPVREATADAERHLESHQAIHVTSRIEHHNEPEARLDRDPEARTIGSGHGHSAEATADHEGRIDVFKLIEGQHERAATDLERCPRRRATSTPSAPDNE